MATPKKSKAKLPKNNTTGYVGITPWSNGKYVAMFRGRKLGYFGTAVKAAEAYDKAAFEALGDKANLNFPTKKAVTE